MSLKQRWRSVTGATIWLTGLSGAGKSTIASAFAEYEQRRGESTRILDGDELRDGLNADLGFTRLDRAENVRRLGEVARLFAHSNMIAIVAAISPYAVDRNLVRQHHLSDDLPFIEAYVNTPLGICEQRDPKRLYIRARADLVRSFTGISDPYEAPVNPEVVLAAHLLSIDDCVRLLHARLSTQRALIDPRVRQADAVLQIAQN